MAGRTGQARLRELRRVRARAGGGWAARSPRILSLAQNIVYVVVRAFGGDAGVHVLLCAGVL